MKKVLLLVLVLILIALCGTGFVFKDDIMSFINNKFNNGEEVIQTVLNVENNSSMSAMMEQQKATLEKKDYRNFLRRTNEEVTITLKEIAKRVPGFDDISNILFVEEDGVKRIDVINLNVYNPLLEQKYTAFIWEDIPTTENPSWNGYFRINGKLLDTIDAALVEEIEETKSAIEKVVEEKQMSLEEFMATEDYKSIITYYGVDAMSEEDLLAAVAATFGNNYSKVEKLYNDSKQNVLLNKEVADMLGASGYGVGYGGKIDKDSYCVVVGELTKDNVLGVNNYLLFKITTNGNYTDYSSTLSTLASLYEKPLSVPEEQEIDANETTTETETVAEETTISETVVQETTTQVETEAVSVESTTPRKNPTDLFEELLKEKEEETLTQDE